MGELDLARRAARDELGQPRLNGAQLGSELGDGRLLHAHVHQRYVALRLKGGHLAYKTAGCIIQIDSPFACHEVAHIAVELQHASRLLLHLLFQKLARCAHTRQARLPRAVYKRTRVNVGDISGFRRNRAHRRNTNRIDIGPLQSGRHDTALKKIADHLGPKTLTRRATVDRKRLLGARNRIQPKKNAAHRVGQRFRLAQDQQLVPEIPLVPPKR